MRWWQGEVPHQCSGRGAVLVNSIHALWIVLLCLLTAGCSKPVVLDGEGSKRCTVSTNMNAADVLAACGLPTSMRYQPKIVGRWYVAELCSAPAYVYGSNAVAFGCDETVAYVQDLSHSDRGLLEPNAALLFDEISRGRHVAAAVAALGHATLSTDEKAQAATLLASIDKTDQFTARSVDRALLSIRGK